MNPFPEPYELLVIFESEPVLADDEVPWFYQHFVYSLERHGVSLQLGVEPVSHRVSLQMSTKQQGTLLET